MSILTFLSKLHSSSLMPLQKKTKKNQSWAQTYKLQNIHNFLADQKGLVKKQTFCYKECSILTFDFRNSFIDVQNQHFMIGHVTVMVANYVTTPQTASIAILKVSALTLHTLISVCIFSILFSKHFLRCQHGEFV